MSIFMIEFQAVPYGSTEFWKRHSHVEVFRDTLEEAIDEIEIAKDIDTRFIDMSAIVFDGPVERQGDRRYLFSWEKEMRNGDKFLMSYIVRELEESSEIKETINRPYEWGRLLEPY